MTGARAGRVRIGQLGVAHAHAGGKARVLAEAPGVDFVGVHEPDAATRAARKDDPAFRGVPWLSESELLGDPTVQGVFVETAPAESLAWAHRALEAGKHVLIDKAPGTSLAGLQAVFDLAGRRDLHVQIGYNFRFNPAFELALAAVRGGLLGDVFNVQAQIPTTVSGYEERRREMERYPGGVFYELACHMVDLVVILLGPPRRVSSYLRADHHGGRTSPYVDNALAVLEYGGALAVVQTWGMGVEPFPHRRLEIFGTRGSVRIEPIEPPRLHLCLAQPQGPYAAGWQTVEVADRPRYVGDVAEFVAVVNRQRQPSYGPAHDLAVQAAVLRASGVGE